MPLNIEIKARCGHPGKIQKILESKNARYIGTDHQVDTYFNVKNGRLKLREGNIENNLIHYMRSDEAGPGKSEVQLYKSTPGSNLKNTLTAALGIFKTVNKQRRIYFIENVKFHIDEVKGPGSFIEIEAIDEDGSIGLEKLHEQCRYYMELFEVRDKDLVKESYSDMVG
ncbi:MAG TPA: CYTH domain-containing protein [Bacteroidetes bacterium]|nr:CYTH domain-containing protein [Bacteroidota bacterium]